MKKYPTLPKALGLEPCNWMQFSIIPRMTYTKPTNRANVCNYACVYLGISVVFHTVSYELNSCEWVGYIQFKYT